jgi:hypothetical protein
MRPIVWRVPINGCNLDLFPYKTRQIWARVLVVFNA